MSNNRMGAAVSTAVLGAALVSATLSMPIASADDPLAPIIADVKEVRSQTRCPQLVYNPVLEDAAQKYARSENQGDARPNNYPFRTDAYLGSGDPQLAAIGSAYNRGAHTSIIDCSFTEFGVGFIRHDDREVDVVTIVFGQPSVSDGSAGAVAPPVVTPPVPPVQCPTGSPTPTVPAGQICAPPSTDSVTMAVSGAGPGRINVTLTNGAAIDASCAYTATPKNNLGGILKPINKTVAVKAKDTATLNEPSPFLGSTYHLSVSCTGTFNGNNVDLGHPEKDVSG
jgi:hypothetical protein